MKTDERRHYQKSLIKGMTDITYGKASDYPFLLNKTYHTLKSFTSGLTAIVRHIEADGKAYNLKEKREVSLVKNEDGELSFLNEILCRIKLEAAKKDNEILQKGIVNTLYASYSEGIILSNWINGEHASFYNRERIRSLFELLLEIEKSGLFEWDLCSGNILFEADQAKLYDFGYMYEMDILKELNPEGMDAKLFNLVERFETRSFMGFLADLNKEEAIVHYRILKEEGIRIFEKKLIYLRTHKAAQEVVQHYSGLLEKWVMALSSQSSLEALYAEEAYRSYALDIEDDLSGKSCTRGTLRKVDRVLEMIHTEYESIEAMQKCLWFDRDMTKDALFRAYHRRREDVVKYQLNLKE